MEEAKRGPGRPRNDDRDSDRKQRVPLGGIKMKLSYPNQDPNYEYRWLNDKGNRINEAQDGGYEFVTRSEGKAGDEVGSDQGTDSRISKVVMTNEDGSPRRAYLMRIKKDWYKQDQVKKQEYLDNIEKQLMRGIDAKGRPGQDGRYIPSSGGTTIERGG